MVMADKGLIVVDRVDTKSFRYKFIQLSCKWFHEHGVNNREYSPKSVFLAHAHTLLVILEVTEMFVRFQCLSSYHICIQLRQKQRDSKSSNPCGEDYGVAVAQVYHFRGNNSIRFSCFKPKWIPLYTDPDDRMVRVCSALVNLFPPNSCPFSVSFD